MKKSFWERRRFFEVYSPGLNAQDVSEHSNSDLPEGTAVRAEKLFKTINSAFGGPLS
jgi:hypothetical protein